VPSTKSDGKGKGFAFLQFEDPENAVDAYLDNDGTIFQGRLLHILSGKAKRNNELDEFAISKLPLKKQKEVLRKKNAGQNAFNWNSLYLNTDAVLTAVAQRLNLSKSELLDHTSSDAAVKQAQAETHVIQETKNYFAQHGVDLETFKKSSKGDVAILVKNIPHGVSADEIRKLFEDHGKLHRFLFPPLGMTAIVEFSNAAQAKAAFSSLSYRKMKDSILYLEKAPKNLFKEGAVVSSTPTSTISVDGIGAKLSSKDLLEEAPKSDSANVATLHVKNLNFSTTTQKLNETFSPLAGFRSAVVRTKIDPKRGVLSLGYGFVEFDSAEAASTALQAMDGHTLEGHALKIQASHRGADAAEERRKEDAAKKATGTKILVKNLPFQAEVSFSYLYVVFLHVLTVPQKKDLRALFAPYGSLRSVRVPKKFDSTSRGFGFVEFSTQRDATNAMNALKNTHLLGRHLVLTFAETESDDPEKELEKMQQKVGAQANKVALQRLTSVGRKKFNVAGTDDLDEA
jgi:multiple RNA-binding domain-containing protein 1